MQNKIKNVVVTLVFTLFIGLFSVLCIINYFNPTESSASERRPLAQFPESITLESVIDKTTIDQFEKASVDQFPFREFFRKIKANFQYNALQLKENNGLAIENGYIGKIESEFNQNFVNNSISRLEYIYQNLLAGKVNNSYVSIIPDKNYFFAEDFGYVSPDYDKLIADIKEKLPEMEYIDLFNSLELEDYYKTDTHWSQDKILEALKALTDGLGVSEHISGNYTENTIDGDFHGVYHGQSATNPAPDKITYLTNESIDSCKVYDMLNKKLVPMYNLELFNGEDGYNIFLNGAAGNPLLKITNPKCENKNTLVVFRDSYGSSMVPLLSEAYRNVVVIDIRSIHPDIIPQLVNLENTDVLFLFSTLVLNSNSFK